MTTHPAQEWTTLVEERADTTRDYKLLGTSDGTSMWALDREHQPEDTLDFLQGAIAIQFTFTGSGRPIYETLLAAAIGAHAATELEYYT